MGVEPEELVRPIRSSGRRAVVELVDSLLSQHSNIHTLAAALQEAFETHPLLFMETHVRPLIPKSMLEDQGGESPESVAARVRQLLSETDDMHVVYDGDKADDDNDDSSGGDSGSSGSSGDDGSGGGDSPRRRKRKPADGSDEQG